MDVISDRYEVGRTLGAGGMARVVEAYDRVLDRKVAIKLLRDDVSIDPSVRERFLREARTAARFNHPNAVIVFDTGQDGRQPWIVMELVEGEDLARRLARDGALDEAEAVHIADGVLAALDAAHAAGMVHRDVKPGNIMLLPDGGVKLADFGIAKSVQDATAGLTSTGQVIGTAKYLSPEQVEGMPATPASDIYALGAVLYEMLAGEPPFSGDTAIAIALAHTRQAVPDLRGLAPTVSPGVAAAVHRALEKTPSQRFTDAGEMRRALAGEAVWGAPATTAVLDQSAQPTRVLSPVTRRRRSAWPLALVVLAALLGAALLFSALTGPDDKPRRNRRDAPARQEQTQEPSEAPPTQRPPATEAPMPTDIPSLIALLEGSGEYGTAQKELRTGLEEVAGLEGDEQAGKAAELLAKTVEWVAAGEIDPTIGAVAVELLEPLAAEPEATEPGGKPDKGKGNGKGHGKPKD
jgi:serine/threonine-protein kinase